MSGVSFAAPQFAHLLWVLVVLAAILWWLDGRFGDALNRLVSSALRDRLVVGVSRPRRRARLVLVTLACMAMVIALMRPQSGSIMVSTARTSAQIVVALDVSRSMLAEDVAPNRLERAKADIRDLLKRLTGDQVGLVAFAGRATVMVPLTSDLNYVDRLLNEAVPGITGRGGTRLEEPIRKAVAGFGSAGDSARTVLLITDGEDLDSFPREAARDAAERGVRIIAIGIGDENGSPIVVTDPATGARTELRDAEGSPVVTRLDGELLRELADITGGAYIPAATGVLDIDAIHAAHIAPLTRGRLQGRSRAIPNEVYQWPVVVAMLLLLAAMTTTAGRPRTVPALVLGLVAFAGAPERPAHAQVNPGQAVQATPTGQQPAAPSQPSAEEQTGNATRSLPDQPREAYNLGVRALGDGRWDDAVNAFTDARNRAATDADLRFAATFNLGATEAARGIASRDDGQTQEAVQALEEAGYWFGEAVSLRPEHTPSRENLERTRLMALQLADSLRKDNDADIAGRIAAATARHGALMATLATAARSGGEDDPRHRATLRTLATSALSGVSDIQEILADAAAEVVTIGEDADDEKRFRRHTLEQAIGHLHATGGRLSQMRSRLRRGQGVAAYRRADRANGSLRRAAEVFLPPPQRLASLGDDAAAQVALGTLAAVAPPPWLSDDLLADRSRNLLERTRELYTLFVAGATAASEPTPPAAQTPGAQGPDAADDTDALMAKRLGEALVPLRAARNEYRAAVDHRADGNAPDALARERTALEALVSAQEAFLELRGLIDRAWQASRQLLASLEPADAGTNGREAQDDEVREQRSQRHRHNLERLQRIGERLEEASAAADPEEQARTEQAIPLWRKALSLAEALTTHLNKQDTTTALADAGALESRLDELRRLYFTIVEHLRDVERQQTALHEDTADLATRASAGDTLGLAADTGTARTVQTSLAERSNDLAAELASMAGEAAPGAQSPAAPATGPQGATPPQATGPSPEDLRRAGTLVDEAGDAMGDAVTNLDATPPAHASATEHQQRALDRLREALKILEPPGESESGQREQPGESGQNESKDDEAQNDVRDDVERMMQGIRDREADRRARRARAPSGQFEVDRDW